MKFIIRRDLLLKSLNNLSKVFNNKQLLPVLNNFKFSLRRDKLEILASNNETSIIDSIDTIYEKGDKVFDYQTTGDCLIPYRVLEIIRKLSGDNVSIDCIDDSYITIDDGNTSFKVNTIRVREYPDFVLSLAGDVIETDAKEFAKSIQQVAFAASNKDTTNLLTGVNITTKNRKLILSATDTARLSRKTIDIASNVENKVTVPAKTLYDVSRMCENASTVQIGFQATRIFFRIGSMIVFTSLIAGDYPNLDGILANRFTIDLRVSAKEIISALERISLLFLDKQTFARFRITTTEFKITSKSQEFGSAVENINNFKFDNQLFEINVDCDNILQGIRAIGKEEIIFKFTGELKPLFVVSPDEPNLILAITPLRMVR